MRSWVTETPAGPFSVLAEDDAVYASGWTTDVAELAALIARVHRPVTIEAAHDLGQISNVVQSYLDGELEAIDVIAVRQTGGPFLTNAWEVLRSVQAGTTLSYSALAARSGRPTAVRAAGSACGRNAAALFVPCHRVTAADGALHDFRYGLDVKSWLLDHESRHAS